MENFYGNFLMSFIRKQSVSSGGNGCSAFEQAILQLEALTCQEISGELSVEQINAITEPIIQLAERQEDLMNLAKRASRQLYCDFTGNSRTERINLAVSKKSNLFSLLSLISIYIFFSF